MSYSKHHLLAMLPLLAILTQSPAVITGRTVNRSIATEAVYPKYEARAAKVSKDLIKVEAQLDLAKYKEKVDKLRADLAKAKQEYVAEEVDAEKVKVMRKSAQDFVVGMLQVQEDNKIIVEKKLRPEAEELAHTEALNDCLQKVEDLLRLERENEFFVLQDKVKKDEIADQETTEQKAEREKKEKEARELAQTEKEKQEKEDKECEEAMAENKVLTEKVEELVADNSKIMEMMMGLLQMMLKNQNQNQYLPYMSGPAMYNHYVMPTYPQIIYVDRTSAEYSTSELAKIGSAPDVLMNVQHTAPQLQMGQHTIQNSIQDMTFNFGNDFWPVQQPRPEYSPMPFGDFGGPDGGLYGFGATDFNVAPIRVPATNQATWI